jgi:hypothetical protein
MLLGLTHEPDAHAKPRQHVDQRIGAEQVYATARRSLTRGCVTRSTFAASACLSLFDQIAFCT